MHFTRTFRYFRRLAIVAGTSGLSASLLQAANSPATKMAPFKVDAQLGVDAVGIQNSTAVLNPYLLEQHGVAQLQDVTGIAPNLFASNSDSRGFGDILSLRGSANSIFFSAPSVALVIDDVPSGSVSSYPSELLNIDSVTVKAGPQGTDYGRNAPAGVIDIKTRVPGGIHQGKLQVDFGSYKARSFQAAFDGPLINNFGYSASVAVAQRDGYIDNTYQGQSADDRHSVIGRGALYWKPDANTQLRFGAQLESIDDKQVRLSSLFSPDPFEVTSNIYGETKIDRKQLSFQARRKFDWGALIATTSKQNWELDPSYTDLDLSPLAQGFSNVVQSEDVWTQEVRFESLPATQRTQWRAGLFYFDSEVDSIALREFAVPPSQFVPPGFIQTERTVFEIGQKSIAGYANLDQPLSRATTLKVGVRWERADADLERTKASSNNFGFPGPQDPRLDGSQRNTYVSASGGLVHVISEALSLQVKTSIAQKPHGYSGFTSNPNLAKFGSEKNWANEVGLTFGPPRSRIGGSVLAFWNQVEDYQIERTVPNSTDYVVVNANEVTSRGVEAKFMWSPVERLWWDFQAGYTDATFAEHRDATGASVNDKKVPFIPKYTVRTGLTADFGGGFSGNISYAAVGRTFFDERNTVMFSQKSYGTASAQLRYRFENWAVTAYAHNVFEKDYYQFINPEIYAASPGAPRRFGVQWSFSY